MSSFEDSDEFGSETITTTTTTTDNSSSTQHIGSVLQTLHGEKSRSFSETVALEDLKYQYDLLEESNRALSVKLARAEAKYENADVDGLLQQIKELKEKNTGLEAQVATLSTDKKKINTELKAAQADVESYKASAEQRTRRVAQLEQQIKILREEHNAFKEAIFELLGIDKSKLTTTTTMELIKHIRGGKHPNKGSEKEIAGLNQLIADLRAQLAALSARPPPVDQGALAKHLEEKHRLELTLANERSSYSKLTHEIKIYRADSEKEAEVLTAQLEAAYEELEAMQEKLKTVQMLATQTLTTNTSAFARLGAVKHHKCKYSVAVFESFEETTSSYSSSSASHSGSEGPSSPRKPGFD
ncbi:hypothetical protein M408DRAFT_330434 [Serendipita vermifera MAFF 305830]|uniref:Uncharacterized protein n=1 Tax=Serendipita vermifera MAFF 305830 TaxID=933852 RepID=A0A0C2XBZ3_SERVB|nr:hypothetical protein M408DRAFT_330434 [Serendipita vermifera MAFF 305830]